MNNPNLIISLNPLTIDDLRKLYVQMKEAMHEIMTIAESDDMNWPLLKTKLLTYDANLNRLDTILKFNLEMFDTFVGKNPIAELMTKLTENKIQIQELLNMEFE